MSEFFIIIIRLPGHRSHLHFSGVDNGHFSISVHQPWLQTKWDMMLVMLRGQANNIEFERNRKVFCLQVVWVWVCESGSAGPGRVTERDSAWRDVTRPAAGLLMSCIAAISATRSRQECSANIIYLGHTAPGLGCPVTKLMLMVQ